jgi:hypothetical protein
MSVDKHEEVTQRQQGRKDAQKAEERGGPHRSFQECSKEDEKERADYHDGG